MNIQNGVNSPKCQVTLPFLISQTQTHTHTYSYTKTQIHTNRDTQTDTHTSSSPKGLALSAGTCTSSYPLRCFRKDPSGSWQRVLAMKWLPCVKVKSSRSNSCRGDVDRHHT